MHFELTCLSINLIHTRDRMKAALARKTGRSEEDLFLEERRRSTRVSMAEDETLPNSSFLQYGSSRQRKDELKIYEVLHNSFL